MGSRTRRTSARSRFGTRCAALAFATAIGCVTAATIVPPLRPASASVTGVDVPTARVYTVAGAGEDAGVPLREGMPATDANLGMIERIAPMPDGGFVVVSFGALGAQRAALVRVDPSGRVRRFPNYRRDVFDEDVAAGPDGSVYVTDGQSCEIMRIDPSGHPSHFAGRPQDGALDGCVSDGDGGRALDARLFPRRIAMSSTGLLVSDIATVRRIGVDGVITPIAGNGHVGRAVDGAAATATPLEMFDEWDEAVCCVAAAPDGTVFITDAAGAWTVTAAGTLKRLPGSRGLHHVDAASLLPDGTLLTWSLASGFAVLAPDGSIRTPLDRDADAVGPWTAFDGDATRLARSQTAALDIDVDADGGWLLGDFGGVRYVTPRAPTRFAVGIAPATLSARLPLTAVVELTQPARVTVRVVVDGRTTGTASAVRPAGRWRLQVPGGRRGKLSTLHVTAIETIAPGRVATDRFAVLPGDTLPMSLPRRLTGASARVLKSVGGGDTVSTCRRFDARRIDCRTVATPPAGDCQNVTAFRLGRDGMVTERRYRYDSTCRFRAHPVWEAGPPSGVPLPTE